MNTGTIIDKLGELKANISELQTQERELKTRLTDSGIETAEGKLFRCCIIRCKVCTINYKGVVEKLDPPKRLLNKFSTSKERIQVRISARNGN